MPTDSETDTAGEPSALPRRARSALVATPWIVGVAVWILAPAAVIGIVALDQADATYSEPIEVLTHPEPASSTLSRDVSILLDWREGRPLVAPEWSGVVQQVFVEPGSRILSGAPVLRISGITRVAAATGEPFFRPLALGSSGPDVVALHGFLSSVGLPVPDGDRFTPVTRASVVELGARLGVPPESRAVFDPAWVVFLPTAEVTAEEVSAVLGGPAPAAGDAIVTTRPELVEATVIAFRDPLAREDGDALADRDRTPVAVPADASLRLGDQELSLAAARDAIAPESLPVIATRASSDALVITGRLDSPPPANGWRLPSGAIVTTAEGRTCVLIRSATGSGEARAVEVLAEAGGIVTVSGDLDGGLAVRVSPPESDRRCA